MVAAAERFLMAVCLSKDGDTRFLGHLDFARLVERSLRRSGLPLVNTQGFNPRQKVSFTDALPVGVASEGEWITLSLHEDLTPETLRERLEPALPECVRLVEVRRGPAPAAPRLRYRLAVTEHVRSATDTLTALLQREHFVLDDARGRPIDIRTSLLTGQAGAGCVEVELGADRGLAPRPTLVAEALIALAREARVQPPVFGVFTKMLCQSERRQKEMSWDDAVAAGAQIASSAESCSSMPGRAKRAG
jgi:radical SAM-linked protein